MATPPSPPQRSDRHARQERLPQIGSTGQACLRSSTAAVIGLGALGGLEAELLLRAGVGRLILIDRDLVEWSNLQRQTLYTEADARQGRPKAEAARSVLSAIDGEVAIEAHAVDLRSENLRGLLEGAQVLVDGTDNFATRYLLNDWAVEAGVPYVYAGAVGTYGMCGCILPGGPCLRCTWPDPPPPEQSPSCRSAGVYGPTVAAIAALAAGEALKVLSGHPEAVLSGFQYLDLWTGENRRLPGVRDPDCPCCAGGERPWLAGHRGAPAAAPLCGGGSVQVPPGEHPVDLAALTAKLEGTVEDLRLHPRFLRFHTDGLEVTLFADGRALIRGTEDPARARALLDRTLGG